MDDNVVGGSFSSSARLSADDTATIDEFVNLGYYSSRASFVFEAIRDISMEIVNDLAAMYPHLPEKATMAEAEELLKDALRLKYVISSGYCHVPRKRMTIMVGINGKLPFLSYSIDKIKDNLALNDLQGVVTFVVYYKLREILKYRENVDGIKNYQKQMTDAYITKAPEDEVEDLLKKAGLLRKDRLNSH